MVVVPVCLNGRCSPGCEGIDRIKKDEGDESLPFLVFWRHIVNAIFLIYSKEGRLSSTHVGIRNIPSDVCYNVTKHYQVQSEHRRTQNSFKHLRWSVFAQIVNTLKSLIGYAKKLHPRCLKGFWICLCCRTRQVYSVQNSRRCYVKYKSTCVCFEIFQLY